MANNKKDKPIAEDGSEFRQDIVSGDWVLIAPGRKKRPHDLVSKEKRNPPPPLEKCPFEDPQGSGNERPSIIRPENSKNWRIQVIPNLYPAVSSDKAVIPSVFSNGPYFYMPGAGYHDIVITRDHYKNFAALSLPEALEVLSVIQERYKMIAEDPRIAYVSIFHNWGPTAGASIYHPHYQIISIPVVPPDVSHSLHGSERYYSENGKCAHCAIIEKENQGKKRVIFENENALAFLPFVSREPFEIRIFPKKHEPYFEDCGENVLKDVAEALQKSLVMLENKLGDVDYNFFIHTAPIKEKERFSYYHWHIEIQPKISTLGGFELSTGIEITIVDPDDGATFLKE
jgi:UDPglucose--hexose-1-phosphate uridylyltransferase